MICRKTVEHNNKKIYVYENVFDQRENINIYSKIVNLPFARTNIDVYLFNNVDRDAKWWSVIDPKSEISALINPRYIDSVTNVDWNRVAIKEQYVNYGTSNSVDIIHTDVTDNKVDTFTMIHYANHTWQPNWHGETLFYSDMCDEVIHTQMIKPGTVIVFDSRIQHSASPCTITAEHPRFTIATKFFLRS